MALKTDVRNYLEREKPTQSSYVATVAVARKLLVLSYTLTFSEAIM